MSAEKNKRDREFSHGVGELVLVKWGDGMVYFAKIKRIDWRKHQCVVIFDDKSTDKATFSQIHSGESVLLEMAGYNSCLTLELRHTNFKAIDQRSR